MQKFFPPSLVRYLSGSNKHSYLLNFPKMYYGLIASLSGNIRSAIFPLKSIIKKKS